MGTPAHWPRLFLYPQVNNAYWNLRRHCVSHQAAMALIRLRFQAQDADLPIGLHQRDERIKLGLRGSGLQVVLKDILHVCRIARSRSGATLRRSAEPGEVQVHNPGLLQIGGKARLRKAGSPRARGGANIHEEFNTRLVQRVQEASNSRGLVANRGKPFHNLGIVRVEQSLTNVSSGAQGV